MNELGWSDTGNGLLAKMSPVRRSLEVWVRCLPPLRGRKVRAGSLLAKGGGAQGTRRKEREGVESGALIYPAVGSQGLSDNGREEHKMRKKAGVGVR